MNFARFSSLAPRTTLAGRMGPASTVGVPGSRRVILCRYIMVQLFTPFHSIEKTTCSLCRLNEFNGRFSSGILDILIFGGVRAYKVSWKDTVILVQWSSSIFNLPKSSTPSRFYGFFRYVIYEWLPWRVLKPRIGPCESVANRMSCCFALRPKW